MSSPVRVIALVVPKPPNAPSASGFCQKLETFLRYTGTPYELQNTYPQKGPKGKVPYATIHRGGQSITIGDSHFIIRYLIKNGLSRDPDEEAGLTPAQKGESRAWQAYMEELLYDGIVYERWIEDDNRAKFMEEIMGQAPKFIRRVIGWLIKGGVRTKLFHSGMGRHTADEVHGLEREGCEALEARLSLHPYFHGDKLSTIDLIIFSFLSNIVISESNPNFTNLILKSPTLNAYTRRLAVQIFPEYEDLVNLLDSYRNAYKDN